MSYQNIRKVAVQPNIIVQFWQPEGDESVARSVAIQTVRNMDADALKQMVIDSLVDADAYPHDFTEIWDAS